MTQDRERDQSRLRRDEWTVFAGESNSTSCSPLRLLFRYKAVKDAVMQAITSDSREFAKTFEFHPILDEVEFAHAKQLPRLEIKD